jgi:hypothetical protein
MLVIVESVLCHCQLVGFKPEVPMVFLAPVCVDQLICPVTGDAAHTQVLQPQVVPYSTEEARDLSGW